MREIGQIKLLQVQRAALKVEDHSHAYYDPTPLQAVRSLLLFPEGVIGVTADGRRGLDIHHAHHPESRNNRGLNGVSVGFTSHYESMRYKFGDHMVDGCAGENILVEADHVLTLTNLGKQLVIQTQETSQLIYLTRLKVAAPCVEFSQFAASSGMALPTDRLKETLQFLNYGRRGFYATVVGQDSEIVVQVGDRVFADVSE